jgi:hypothetical protein
MIYESEWDEGTWSGVSERTVKGIIHTIHEPAALPHL